MNIAEIERLILEGVARLVRAEQLSGPIQDICYPRMIGEQERFELRKAQSDLMLASIHAQGATERFRLAAEKLGEYLNA